MTAGAGPLLMNFPRPWRCCGPKVWAPISAILANPDGSLSRSPHSCRQMAVQSLGLLESSLPLCPAAAGQEIMDVYLLKTAVLSTWLIKAYFAAPPPPAHAREMTHTKKSHVLLANPKVVLEQSKKYARGALEHFNKKKKLCSKRKSSSGVLVTCCEPLGPQCTVGHKGFQLDGSVARKNVDFTRCFACTPRMLHPQGEKYIAGHCNIPYIYDSPC